MTLLEATRLLERLAYLQELREKRQALRAKGKHDLALTQVINDIDQEVCEWPAVLLREAHAALTAKEAAIEAQAGELARLRKRIRDAAIKGNTYLLHEKHREGLEVLTLEVSQVFDELTAALKGVNHEP